MEKDIGKIKKNNDTDIVIRLDDFGGKIGLTIREFVNQSETGYKGFTKSGTRIPSESFEEFKKMINSVKSTDLKNTQMQEKITRSKDDEDSGINESGLM